MERFGKKGILAAGALAVAAVAVFLMFATGQRYKSISPEQAQQIMASDVDYRILDVRKPEEYAEGHLPGALNLPLDEILDERVGILTDKNQTLLIYCKTGRRSRAAAEVLADLGYNHVYEFGGIVDWPGDIVDWTGNSVKS